MLTQYAQSDIMAGMSKKTHTVDLAEQLRTAFEKSGMSMFELGKRSGVAYSGVHRFITGDRDVTLETASKLAEILGVELRPRKGTRK